MEIKPYDFSGKTVRIITGKSGDFWWVASDVCLALGLSNPTETLKALDDYEKSTLRIS
jgi:prophage antirepressor-like protein